jgi:phosphoglycolate phosphatase-like HAD superfamily hydrolase
MQETIAVIFDFDDTLAPDSTSSFLNSIGINVKSFWNDEVSPLIQEGWDPVPAYLYRMVQRSGSGNREALITREKLAEWGKQIQLYNGATRIFDRLRKHAHSIDPNIAVEFYLISSGISETLRATRIAQHFHDIWACEFAYGEDGRILFPRNIVSFTDKTRYIFHISKGIVGKETRGKPFEVNRKIPAEHLRVPINQMIFVGDGYTDIPCFSLIRKNDGVAIGVYDPDDRARWGRAWGFIEDGRVSNLARADYGTRSSLSDSLMMAIESIARRIALRRHTYQG